MRTVVATAVRIALPRSTATIALRHVARRYSSSPSASIQLLNRAQTFTDRIAIATPEGEHSYRQLLANSSELSRHVIDCANEEAVRRRDFPVAFLTPRDYSYSVTMYAIWQSGGIAVPLCNTHPPAELEYHIQDSHAAAVVHPEYEGIIVPIGRNLGVPVLSLREYLDAWMSGRYDNLATAQTRRDHNERAMLIYTSGTTGRPKGVLSTHSIITSQVTALIDAWHWTQNDRLLHTLPLHHVHGVVAGLLSALWAGATCDMRRGFSPAGVWSDLLRTDASVWGAAAGGLPPPATGQPEHGVTLFMGVPTMYAKLIQYYDDATRGNVLLQREIKEACMERIRLMVSGSAPLAVPVMQRWGEITGHTLLERYGMTEIGLVVSNPYNGERVPGTVGHAIGGVRVRIVEEGGRGGYTDVAQGQSGELWIAGPTVFDQYWNRPEATAEAFHEEWFRTGDEAVIDREGRVKILGRQSADVLKTGGYKVSALEIENILMENKRLQECCVVGVQDDVWGQRVAAVVIPVAGETITLEDLQAFAKPRMAPYKVPTVLRVLDAIPRNAMGKINKKALVKELF